MWLFYSPFRIIKITYLNPTSYSCALLNSPISAVILSSRGLSALLKVAISWWFFKHIFEDIYGLWLWT